MMVDMPGDAPRPDAAQKHPDKAEIARLLRQGQAWAPETEALLERIGVSAGWQCLDLGCGPLGITRALCDRVGPNGKVVGLDTNPAFVAAAQQDAPETVEIIVGDAHQTGLPSASFDLVHMRFLAWTTSDLQALIDEALRVLKPGGVFVMQEADGSTLKCFPPLPAWTRTIEAFRAMMPDAIGDYPAAHAHFQRLRRAGLLGVDYRLAILGATAGDLSADLWPVTIETAAPALISYGFFAPDELRQILAEIYAHIEDPGTTTCSPMLVQVWGQKPKG